MNRQVYFYLVLINLTLVERVVCAQNSLSADYTNVNVTIINVASMPYYDPFPSTFEAEYFCLNAFQWDMLNETRFIVGLCQPDTSAQTYSFIGSLPTSVLDSEPSKNITDFVSVLYGNPSSGPPTPATELDSWDGIDSGADVGFPEHFIQAENGSVLYFMDSQSCLRKVDRWTGSVSTVIGLCQNGTLAIPGIENMQAYGMEYFEKEEKRVFVFTIGSYGLYFCYEQTIGMEDYDCSQVIDFSYTSMNKNTTAGMLLRGIDTDGKPNEFVWQKADKDILRYNFSNIYNNAAEENYDFDSFVHYTSIHTGVAMESNEWHKDTTQDLGLSDATISFSADGTIMLVIDFTDNRIYFIDTDPSDGIDNFTKFCESNLQGVREDNPDNCTFTDITGGTWFDSRGLVVVTEKNPVMIRIIQTSELYGEESFPDTTMIDTTIYTTTTKATPMHKYVDVTLWNTTTIPYDDPYPTTPEIEYFCRNAFQLDVLDESRFIVGLCRPGSGTTSAIGLLQVSVLDAEPYETYNQSVNVLYGNPSVPAPGAATEPDSWDGINMAANISFPEQFIQTKNGSILYFIDIRSCLRKVDRLTGEVSTVIGICQNGTMEIPGTGNMQSYGMAYFEEDRIFVVTVTNHGLYVCYEQTVGMEDYECRRTMEYKYISERIAINARMLLRGINPDGEPNEFVWQKVRHGLNRYNYTEVFDNISNTSVEILPDNDTFVHYATIHTRETLEPNAWHKDTTQDLGLSDATIYFSADGSIMLDIDSTNDGLYFIDTDPSDGIDNMTKLCDLNHYGVRNDSSDPTNCTFTDVTGGVWLEYEGVIVITEKDPVALRVVQIESPPPLFFTTTPAYIDVTDLTTTNGQTIRQTKQTTYRASDLTRSSLTSGLTTSQSTPADGDISNDSAERQGFSITNNSSQMWLIVIVGLLATIAIPAGVVLYVKRKSCVSGNKETNEDNAEPDTNSAASAPENFQEET